LNDDLKRVVLTGPEYRELWWKKYFEQEGKCADCGKSGGLQLHHIHGRGLAGGFRRDTELETVLLCRSCHSKEDQSRPSKYAEE
jgi:5-methylcytosine-specific restriction endonuclease McrA